MNKLLFIYNPHAGKARLAPHLNEMLEIFRAAGYITTAVPTNGPRDAVSLARLLAHEYDHVICAGGDGTLSEVITGLVDAEYTGALGYLPAGSTNDFSRTLALPAGAEAARAAVSGQPVACDVGSFNDRLFIYVAAFGMFTAVSYETPQEFKNLFGHMAYVLEGIRSLTEVTSYHLRVAWDDGALEGDFLYGAISNSVSIGGFRGILSDRVVLDDGLFEVMLVKTPTSIVELNSIATALLRGEPCESVLAFQTGTLRITSDEEIPWTLDGENGGRHREANIHSRRSAVRLMRPAADASEGTPEAARKDGE